MANLLDAVPVSTRAHLAGSMFAGFACGLLTVRSRLQLRCGWCAVVLAASWLALLA